MVLKFLIKKIIYQKYCNIVLMKINKFKFHISIFFFLMLGLQTMTAKTKIGVVNFDEIYYNMPESKKYDSMMHEYWNNISSQIQKFQFRLNEKIDNYIKDSSSMSKSKKLETEMEIQDSTLLLTYLEQDSQKDFENKKQELAKPIVEKINKAIAEVSIQLKLTLVVYKDDTAYYLESIDITNKVKQKLGLNT